MAGIEQTKSKVELAIGTLRKAEQRILQLCNTINQIAPRKVHAEDFLEGISEARTALNQFSECLPDSPAPQFVYVTTIEHRHGTNVCAYRDDDAATIGVASFCREWESEAREFDPDLPEFITLENQEVIDAYFGAFQDESYSIERIEVEG